MLSLILLMRQFGPAIPRDPETIIHFRITARKLVVPADGKRRVELNIDFQNAYPTVELPPVDFSADQQPVGYLDAWFVDDGQVLILPDRVGLYLRALDNEVVATMSRAP